MKLRIREGTILDDELCGAIMLGALVIEDIPRSFLKDNILMLPLRSNLRFIALYDEAPAGFCDYSVSKSHINYLFVDPLFQANGVGTYLLENVQRRLEAPISVNVLCRNEKAILWYLKKDFIVTKLWSEQFNGQLTPWLKLTRKTL